MIYPPGCSLEDRLRAEKRKLEKGPAALAAGPLSHLTRVILVVVLTVCVIRTEGTRITRVVVRILVAILGPPACFEGRFTPQSN